MKFKMVLAALALSVMSVSAQAQIQIVLDAGDPLNPTSAQDATSPGSVTFGGTIFNSGPDDIFIIGDGVGVLPPGVTADVPGQDPDASLWEFRLAGTIDPDRPNSLNLSELFTLTIPGGVSSFGGTYHIDTRLENQDPDDPNFIPTPYAADFRVNIQGPGRVPEPGAMALLVSGLIGGSLFMVRRRK